MYIIGMAMSAWTHFHGDLSASPACPEWCILSNVSSMSFLRRVRVSCKGGFERQVAGQIGFTDSLGKCYADKSRLPSLLAWNKRPQFP